MFSSAYNAHHATIAARYRAKDGYQRICLRLIQLDPGHAAEFTPATLNCWLQRETAAGRIKRRRPGGKGPPESSPYHAHAALIASRVAATGVTYAMILEELKAAEPPDEAKRFSVGGLAGYIQRARLAGKMPYSAKQPPAPRSRPSRAEPKPAKVAKPVKAVPPPPRLSADATCSWVVGENPTAVPRYTRWIQCDEPALVGSAYCPRHAGEAVEGKRVSSGVSVNDRLR